MTVPIPFQLLKVGSKPGDTRLFLPQEQQQQKAITAWIHSIELRGQGGRWIAAFLIATKASIVRARRNISSVRIEMKSTKEAPVWPSSSAMPVGALVVSLVLFERCGPYG